MTVFRALLACIWVLFSLTATAAPATAADMSCHMEMNGEHHKPDAPAAPPIVMPCCSQPVLVAGAEPVTLLSRPYQMARLKPAVASPLSSLPARLEPRPPKTV